MIINGGDRFHNFTIDFEDEDSPQVRHIVYMVLPKLFQLFSDKNKEYGGAEEELGIRAQFVDINRKFRKLKKGMWDGKPEDLTGEPLEEILRDLAGHVFLTLHMLEAPAFYPKKLVAHIPPGPPPSDVDKYLSEVNGEIHDRARGYISDVQAE